ncbi:helix-turn-helix domain-containing protein [Streptomyces lunaelactis]|uniref:helix-turn-helix domain-containing protein n=1 Tax=Streptomyces lunaelactis TaxID=1535768 RepID=UPI001584B6EE|nr:helix-turn-helix transcriptional regulator [Streptomyces lunaelactis]NUK02088.1 helix-turn-helix domain-containing protein [Streptomyces lunaelactis]NUK16070.1 helix-turn-helix domain-containing protein [Streptomyces lunaelactis]
MANSGNKELASTATQLSAEIARVLRNRKGLTQEQVGKQIGYTASAVSAMETGAQPASDEMYLALDAAIGDGLGIFKSAVKYVRLDKFPKYSKDFLLLEQRAITLSVYEATVIYGLFQTEAYARALISGGYPPLSEQRVNELVEARLARRALLEQDPPPLIELILDEAALRRRLGSPDIMREQLLQLLVDGRRRNVTLQVMPLDRGLRGEHAGVRGPMILVQTKDHEHLFYMEAQGLGTLIEDPAAVTPYSHRYAKIRAEALSPDESLAFVEQLAGEQ